MNPAIKNLGQLLDKNSPTILTAMAAAGVVTTAILSHKAAVAVTWDRAYGGRGERPIRDPETPKELIQTYWRDYIPPVIAGTVTIGCIVAAHTTGAKRQAAVASAYLVNEKLYEEYRAKVVEKYGESKERDIRDEVQADRARRADETNILVTDSGESLFYESYTDRYFKSDMQKIRSAVNQINNDCNHHMYASLNDFFRYVGLPTAGVGDDVGWNVDELLEIDFSGVLTPSDKPAVAISYRTEPTRTYARFH